MSIRVSYCTPAGFVIAALCVCYKPSLKLCALVTVIMRMITRTKIQSGKVKVLGKGQLTSNTHRLICTWEWNRAGQLKHHTGFETCNLETIKRASVFPRQHTLLLHVPLLFPFPVLLPSRVVLIQHPDPASSCACCVVSDYLLCYWSALLFVAPSQVFIHKYWQRTALPKCLTPRALARFQYWV